MTYKIKYTFDGIPGLSPKSFKSYNSAMNAIAKVNKYKREGNVNYKPYSNLKPVRIK